MKTEDSKKQKEAELYAAVELEIIKWSINNTKTAGHLTRKLLKILKKHSDEKSKNIPKTKKALE